MIFCVDKGIKKAADFYAAKLGLEQELIKINTTHLKPDDEVDGAAYPQYCGHYLIDIKTNGGRNPYLVLAHEMWHIRQYHLGHLSLDSENKTATWKGEVFKFPEVVNYTDEFYYTNPWEKEAFDMESKLFYDWIMF